MKMTFKKCLIFLLIVLFAFNNKIYALTRVEFENAFKETAYAYYMRNENIQYNSMKTNGSGPFSPEEATSQNTNYVVCSGFTHDVYYELLGELIPNYTNTLINYTKRNVGKPEVIGYGLKNNNDLEMYFYTGNNEDECIYNDNEIKKCKTKKNPTIDEIISYLKVGDILTYTGHTGMLYDLIKDENENVIDAYFIESTHGKNKGYYVTTKIDVNSNHYLYHNDGSLKITDLKSETSWCRLIGENGGKCSNPNYNSNYRVDRNEYSILRFVSDDIENVKLQFQNSEKMVMTLYYQ